MEESRESPYEECSATLLGFGEFKDWIYGEILTDKPRYVSHLWTENDRSSPGKKMFADWLKLTEYTLL